MVELRLDPRLRQRLDPEDVVQEVYLEAADRLAERDRTLSFLLWLRLLCAQRLAELQRRHLGAARRDVRRERPAAGVPVVASNFLERLTDRLTSPSEAAARDEARSALREALALLSAQDQEILALRHFEQLNGVEAAAELGIDRSAAAKRYTRALRRLQELLRTWGGAP